MDPDVLAEFECVCAESRRMLRMSCTECDICFYYNSMETDNIAQYNPWSFLTEDPFQDEIHEVENQLKELEIDGNPTLVTPIPQYPSATESRKRTSSPPIPHGSFDDSLILPNTVVEDLDASIARRKAAINEALFRIGVIPGLSDPISTYGPYELNRKDSFVQPPSTTKRTLSIRRPRKSSEARPINCISIDLYDQLADLPDDVPTTPTTPELESPTGLYRLSTSDWTEASFSEEEIDTPSSGHDPVIRRISDLEQLGEFAQMNLESSKQDEMLTVGQLADFPTPLELKDWNSRRNRLMKRSRPTIHL